MDALATTGELFLFLPLVLLGGLFTLSFLLRSRHKASWVRHQLEANHKSRRCEGVVRSFLPLARACGLQPGEQGKRRVHGEFDEVRVRVHLAPEEFGEELPEEVFCVLKAEFGGGAEGEPCFRMERAGVQGMDVHRRLRSVHPFAQKEVVEFSELHDGDNFLVFAQFAMDAPEVMAFLSPENRRVLLRSFAQESIALGRGWVSLRVLWLRVLEEGPLPGERRLREALDLLLRFVEAWQWALEDVPARLLANLEEEESGPFRQLMLGALLTSYGESLEAQEAVEQVLRSRDPFGLYALARERPKLRLSLLREILEMVGEGGRVVQRYPMLARRTLELLSKSGDAQALGDFFRALLHGGGLPSVVEEHVVHALVGWEEEASVPDLLQFLRRNRHRTMPLVPIVMHALARLWSHEVEETFVELLEGGDTTHHLVLMEALARHASVAAVESLLLYRQRGDVSAALELVAQRAVGQIQARLQGAGAGQLSLAGESPSSDLVRGGISLGTGAQDDGDGGLSIASEGEET